MTAALKLDERITVEDYLQFERHAPGRHVFLDGKVWAMAGESLSHGRVSVNLVGLVHSQLRGKRCEPLAWLRGLLRMSSRAWRGSRARTWARLSAASTCRHSLSF